VRISSTTFYGTVAGTTPDREFADEVSSARYKQDIVTMESRSEGVFKRRPVTFAYRADPLGVWYRTVCGSPVARPGH
jgi:hypothetical protein